MSSVMQMTRRSVSWRRRPFSKFMCPLGGVSDRRAANGRSPCGPGAASAITAYRLTLLSEADFRRLVPPEMSARPFAPFSRRDRSLPLLAFP
ncbi:unnamed protein product, partial [Nesidiocoris tenuis]